MKERNRDGESNGIAVLATIGFGLLVLAALDALSGLDWGSFLCVLIGFGFLGLSFCASLARDEREAAERRDDA